MVFLNFSPFGHPMVANKVISPNQNTTEAVRWPVPAY